MKRKFPTFTRWVNVVQRSENITSAWKWMAPFSCWTPEWEEKKTNMRVSLTYMLCSALEPKLSADATQSQSNTSTLRPQEASPSGACWLELFVMSSLMGWSISRTAFCVLDWKYVFLLDVHHLQWPLKKLYLKWFNGKVTVQRRSSEVAGICPFWCHCCVHFVPFYLWCTYIFLLKMIWFYHLKTKNPENWKTKYTTRNTFT